MTKHQGLPWWHHLRRLVFRNTMAALIATAAEFVLVVGLKAGLHLAPSVSTAIGCIFGGVVNYIINHKWTFQTQGPHLGRALRYAAVSLAGTGLAYGGVALGCRYVDWRLAWALTHIVCSWGWHLPMQRYLVFGKPAYQQGTPQDPSVPTEQDPASSP
ncbi:MAG: GtrA family protein [Deltaproteobacteria bacterium]|nr:MAG: GtrA family protein [Deltaproteobacteria bacterium]